MAVSRTLTVLRSVLTNVDRLGVPIPKATRSDFDKLDTMANRARSIRTAQAPDIGAALVDAIAADRDPTTDPAVVAAAVGLVIIDKAGTVEAAVNARADRFVADHADAIVAALAEPFTTAAEAIVAALDVLGDAPVDNARELARRGPDHVAAWAYVQDAHKTIAGVAGCWHQLAALAHVRTDTRLLGPLVICDPDPAGYVALDVVPGELTPWDLARKGWPLELATFASYRARVLRVNAARDDRQAERENAAADAWKRTHSLGRIANTA